MLKYGESMRSFVLSGGRIFKRRTCTRKKRLSLESLNYYAARAPCAAFDLVSIKCNEDLTMIPDDSSKVSSHQVLMTQILIILGPPRSFTTVVSAMLGQHPQMYGLPEIHLFVAETMEEWWQQCANATFNMDHGLIRVVAQLFFGGQTEVSASRAAGW